jgi:hypothetical protein
VRKPLHATALPPLAVTLDAVGVEPARVARYREVCGAATGGPVPPVFAYVLAAPAQLTLLTHRDFPLRVLGTVHVRNRSRLMRPLVAGEVVGIGARPGGLRETPRGLEYELVTEVTDSKGAVVWEGLSTYLLVDRTLARVQRGVHVEAQQFDELEPIAVPADIGRRYGGVSGDLNPIHMHPVLARLFGFPRALAHGMWTLARALAALESRLPRTAMTVDVWFRKPLFTPASVVLHWTDDGQGIRFAVRSAGGDATHAQGSITSA